VTWSQINQLINQFSLVPRARDINSLNNYKYSTG